MTQLNPKSKIGFIGAGVVGGSLAVALSQNGYAIVAAASRTFASAQALAARVPGCAAFETGQEVADAAEFVFITTTDDAIEHVAAAVSWRPGQGVAHCSGAASLDVLSGPAAQGAIAGAFHPVQAFSSVEGGVKSIPGITFGIEGNPEVRSFLDEMALAIGGIPIFLKPEDKALYHASAVMMGNLLTVLAAVASGLWSNIGLTRADGVKALAPMMRQVSINLETSGIPGAVAGPYIRGDVGTIRKHLEALHLQAPDVLPLYRELAKSAIPFALEKGTLTADEADVIRALVEGSHGGCG